MTIKRYTDMFRRLRQSGEGAFVPFVVAGDPNPNASCEIMLALAESGADALEIGLPFTDPVADGPAIQKANIRALDNGTTPSIALKLIAEQRKKFPKLPIGILVYANIIEAFGKSQFYASTSAAGVDSVLVADVPTIEAATYSEEARRHDIHPVFIATSNCSDAQLRQISSISHGYTYVVTRAGVTGADSYTFSHGGLIQKLKFFGAPPSLLGFGISNTQQVRAAVRSGANGVISGSAIANIIESNRTDLDTMLRQLRLFASHMKTATMP